MTQLALAHPGKEFEFFRSMTGTLLFSFSAEWPTWAKSLYRGRTAYSGSANTFATFCVTGSRPLSPCLYSLCTVKDAKADARRPSSTKALTSHNSLCMPTCTSRHHYWTLMLIVGYKTILSEMCVQQDGSHDQWVYIMSFHRKYQHLNSSVAFKL